jgi:hypothetical protein
MNSPKTLILTVIVLTAALLTSPANSTNLVDFGGNYFAQGSYVRLEGSPFTWQLAEDFGDDGDKDDIVFRRPYSELTPLTEGVPIYDLQGRRETFYGGFETWKIDPSYIGGSGSGYFYNRAAEDSIAYYPPLNASSSYCLLEWKKDDFLAFSSKPNIRFDGSPQSRLSATISGGSSYASDQNKPLIVSRLVVENAGQFYLSESSWSIGNPRGPSSFALAGADLLAERWASYDPSTDLRANGAATADGLTFNIGTDEFNDIVGVGVYFEHMARFSSGSGGYELFNFEANAVPEPATLSLLIPGFVTPLFCGWLKRRKTHRDGSGQ